jgi:hypothetical protein
MSGRRTDYEYRPELRNGTVEYIVPEDYWAKKPQPIHYLFAVDVSLNAVQSGMLASFCQGLSSILYGDDAANRLPEGAKIGLVTFDRSMHFYNLKVREQSGTSDTLGVQDCMSLTLWNDVIAHVRASSAYGCFRCSRCFCAFA